MILTLDKSDLYCILIPFHAITEEDGLCQKLTLVYEGLPGLTHRIAKDAIGEYKLVGIHKQNDAPIYRRNLKNGGQILIFKQGNTLEIGLIGYTGGVYSMFFSIKAFNVVTKIN
jgi:hypothetical protein